MEPIKTVLMILAIIFIIILWLLATMLTINDKGQDKLAFIFKSISYWLAILIAIGFGYLI